MTGEISRGEIGAPPDLGERVALHASRHFASNVAGGVAGTSPAAPDPEAENCVLILAPYGQDAALLADTLKKAGVEDNLKTALAADIPDFIRHLPRASAGVLTAEALTPHGLAELQKALQEQLPWSDIPLILLTKRIDAASYALLAQSLGNVTIIGRPLDSASFITVVKTALRARRRQYQVRDLVSATESQNERIRALNDRLNRAMTETHHRVKNNLQLIVAFVTLLIQEGEDSVPVEQIARVNSQVRTLAAVHDILTMDAKEGGTGDFISTRLLLVKLLEMMRDMAEGKRLTYTVDDTLLPSHQGTSLALVANELTLNAIKYGRTEINVNLSVNCRSATLTVSDDGPGLPDNFQVEECSNTGLALVENLAHWDLQGDAVYGNRADGPGARIEIAFPLPAPAPATGR